MGIYENWKKKRVSAKIKLSQLPIRDAVRRGFIRRGFNHSNKTNKMIRDGWENVATGNNYPTQREAYAAFIEYYRRLEDDKADAEYHWDSLDKEERRKWRIEYNNDTLALNKYPTVAEYAIANTNGQK